MRQIKTIIRNIILVPVLIWTLFPVYWMVSLAFRSSDELAGKISLLPHSVTFVHILELFQEKGFGAAIVNSITVAVISLAIALVCGIPCAYIFSRKNYGYRLRTPMMGWVLLIRVLPPIAFAIPLYAMMNYFGLLSTSVPIILSHVLLNLPFIIWFLISFFAGTPIEIEESARVDGAGDFTIFFKVILPLVAPGIAAVAILSFMTSWNEYLYGVIFVQSPQQFTIPLVLSTMNSEQELTQWGTVAAGGVVSLIPIILFVALAQDALISGLSGGAVKE